MSQHDDGEEQLLAEYLLGTLPPEEAAEVAARLRADPALRAEADALSEVLGTMALSLPPEAPPPELRERILDSIGDEVLGPLGRFSAKVAALFDLTADRARELLRRLEDAAAWSAGPCEGISLLHVAGGPRVATADVGFVRLEPGVQFPHHSHGGDEVGLILQGGFLDSDGREYHPGEAAHHGPGSDHDFTALPGEICVFAVVVFGGVKFDNGFQI